jgi:hypothetical protein
MVAWSLVVPTNGESPYLMDLLLAAPEAEERFVIWTESEPPPEFPISCTVITDVDRPKNVHRWWNSGIRAAPSDIVVVTNDDIEAPPGALDGLAAALSNSGKTMAMVEGGFRNISGWCYALDRSHHVLPNEEYRWHAGDWELRYRAEPPPAGEGRGVLMHTGSGIIHHKFRRTEIKAMRDVVLEDGVRWRASPYYPG